MPGHPIHIELEAKLLVPTTKDLQAIARLDRLGAYPLRARGVVRLHSSYLDTPDLTLARHGVALRIRRQGRRWEATMKWAGGVDGDVHERPELTVALPSAPVLPFLPPSGPLHTQLAALMAGRPLTPILTSDVRRRLFDVLPSDPAAAAATPAPIAELALDSVRLHAPQEGQAEATYSEVEIECREGDRRVIADLAQMLRCDFGLLPSSDSKFARGLALLYGSEILNSSDQRVLAEDTTAAAVRHMVAHQLHQLRSSDPGTRSGEPEALHDMRVATRRLRAALRIFAAGIPVRHQTRLSDELQWLGKLLGRVRDLDVQLEKLDRFTAAAPAGFRPALGLVRAHLDAERLRCRANMVAGLDTRRYFRLLIRLEHFASGREARRRRDAAALESIAATGRGDIKKAFRRLLKRGAKIEATPYPEDLHALRMRAKRLRYLLEFLQELTGKPGRLLVKRLTELQDLLGSYHDAVVAAEFVRSYVESTGTQLPPASMMAFGALVASELRLAEEKRADFERTWERFTRERTLDAAQAVVRRLRDMQSPPASESKPAPEPVAAVEEGLP